MPSPQGFEYMIQSIVYVPFSSLNAEDLKHLEQAYRQSFPASERRPWANLTQPQHAEQEALAVYEDNHLCGLLHLWRMVGVLFVEYFCVLEAYRNAGVGSAVITDLIKQLPTGQVLVLEAEPADTSHWAQRRLAFYERCGLLPLDLPYYQPAFDGSGGRVPLRLLFTQPISSVQANTIAQQIHRLVYGSEFILD